MASNSIPTSPSPTSSAITNFAIYPTSVDPVTVTVYTIIPGSTNPLPTPTNLRSSNSSQNTSSSSFVKTAVPAAIGGFVLVALIAGAVWWFFFRRYHPWRRTGPDSDDDEENACIGAENSRRHSRSSTDEKSAEVCRLLILISIPSVTSSRGWASRTLTPFADSLQPTSESSIPSQQSLLTLKPSFFTLGSPLIISARPPTFNTHFIHHIQRLPLPSINDLRHRQPIPASPVPCGNPRCTFNSPSRCTPSLGMARPTRGISISLRPFHYTHSSRLLPPSFR